MGHSPAPLKVEERGQAIYAVRDAHRDAPKPMISLKQTLALEDHVDPEQL